MGIEDERIRLEWIAASEGDKVQKVTNEMVKHLKELGPLNLDPIPQPGSAESAEAEVVGAGAEGAS
jgi:F420-non-reducing hydrogenase iron-sulfur subunit